MTLFDFTMRLVTAFALGSVIGLERQFRQRMAGLRTNALVATGTALFVMITPLVGAGAASATQIPAYVVSGIGFLAGGVIFKERLSVSGLNTAATIWCTAALGALVGIGALWPAAVGATIVLAANVVLRPIAQRINRRPADETEMVSCYEVRAVCRHDVEDRVRAAVVSSVRGNAMVLHAVRSQDIEGSPRVEIVADILVNGRADARLERIVSRLGVESGVSAVSWKVAPASAADHGIVPEA